MKYEVTFTATIRDASDGYTRSMWSATKEVEAERLSSLIPMMVSIELVVEQWRQDQAARPAPPPNFGT